MNNPYKKEIIEDVASELGISNPAFVEKDIFVTKVIEIMNDLTNDHFNLVFTGGTCLAKAHQFIQRMSEDIDLKITNKLSEVPYNKTKHQEFRNAVLKKLEQKNFHIIDKQASDEYKYFKIALSYPSYFDHKNDNLRPHILLKFTNSVIYEKTVEKPVHTLIDSFIKKAIHTKENLITCSGIVDIAAEKLIALIRRISSIYRKHEKMDHTLVRHLYDIAIINKHHTLNNKLFTNILNKVIKRAQEKFNRHKEFNSHPLDEIKHSLLVLENESHWKKQYDHFLNDMVYGPDKPSYEEGLKCICQLFENMFKKTERL